MNRRFDPVRHRARAQCGKIRGESLFRSVNSSSIDSQDRRLQTNYAAAKSHCDRLMHTDWITR